MALNWLFGSKIQLDFGNGRQTSSGVLSWDLDLFSKGRGLLFLGLWSRRQVIMGLGLLSEDLHLIIKGPGLLLILDKRLLFFY